MPADARLMFMVAKNSKKVQSSPFLCAISVKRKLGLQAEANRIALFRRLQRFLWEILLSRMFIALFLVVCPRIELHRRIVVGFKLFGALLVQPISTKLFQMFFPNIAGRMDYAIKFYVVVKKKSTRLRIVPSKHQLVATGRRMDAH